MTAYYTNEGFVSYPSDPGKHDPKTRPSLSAVIGAIIVIGLVLVCVIAIANVDKRPASQDACADHGGVKQISRGEGGTAALCADDTTHWVRPE